MAKNGIWAVAVVEGERLAGIPMDVTSCSDALRDLSVDEVTAAAVMTRQPVTVEIDDPISDASKSLRAVQTSPVMENMLSVSRPIGTFPRSTSCCSSGIAR